MYGRPLICEKCRSDSLTNSLRMPNGQIAKRSDPIGHNHRRFGLHFAPVG